MRAKFVKESVADVLAPKSKEEIFKNMYKEFERRNKATFEEVQKLVKELNDLGVVAKVDPLDPERKYIPDGNPITLGYWTIYDSNSHITDAPTKEYAEQLFLCLKNFSLRDKYLTVNEPDLTSLSSRTYISVKEAKELINRVRYGIRTTMKGEFVNKKDKWDHPGYDEWYVTKGRDLMKKRMERGEDID